MTLEAGTRSRQLTAVDRCDRCSARAVVETEMQGGSALLWCGHHFDSFHEALTSFGAEVISDCR